MVDSNNSNYRSLYDLFNIELSELGLSKEYSDISNFISDDKKCLDFIKLLLNDALYDDFNQHKLAKDRAKHSVITFLLGQVLKNFSGIYYEFSDVVNFFDSVLNQKIWMYVSLYHDYGYFSEYVRRDMENYDSIVKYNLFANNYNKDELNTLNNFNVEYPRVLHYTYDEIMNYDKYARLYHKSHNSNEKSDHGILGGILVFDKLVKKQLNNDINNKDWNLVLIKAVCLTIAQHNIFKSNKKDRDKLYLKYNLNRLTSDSTLKIGIETPLLLFLSLVDTIECVKKFGKAKNPDNYLEVKTVLKGIKFSATKNFINIDYTELRITAERKNLDFKAYFDSVLGLEKWTEFKIYKNNDNIISIELSSKDLYKNLKNNIFNNNYDKMIG